MRPLSCDQVEEISMPILRDERASILSEVKLKGFSMIAIELCLVDDDVNK